MSKNDNNSADNYINFNNDDNKNTYIITEIVIIKTLDY